MQSRIDYLTEYCSGFNRIIYKLYELFVSDPTGVGLSRNRPVYVLWWILIIIPRLIIKKQKISQLKSNSYTQCYITIKITIINTYYTSMRNSQSIKICTRVRVVRGDVWWRGGGENERTSLCRHDWRTQIINRILFENSLTVWFFLFSFRLWPVDARVGAVYGGVLRLAYFHTQRT